MICRSGAHYTGPWGAPALYALEGVSIVCRWVGSHGFCFAGDESRGARSLLSSKVKLGRTLRRGWSEGAHAEGATDIVMNAEILLIRATKDCLLEYRWRDRLCAPMGTRMQNLREELDAREIIVEHKVAVPGCARDWFRC